MTDFNNIPTVLKPLKIWVLYRIENNVKKPYQINNTLAKSNDPSTWYFLNEVIKAYETGKFDGIGLMFNGEIGGIDLDHCIRPDNTVEPWAVFLINKIKKITNDNFYAEISPSKQGLHIIFFIDQLSKDTTYDIGGTEEHKHVEFHFRGRYFTYTGNVFEGHNTISELKHFDINEIIGEFESEFYDQFSEGTKKRIDNYRYNSQKEKTDFLDPAVSIQVLKEYYEQAYDSLKLMAKRTSKNEYVGSHPIHDSTTGTNFSINVDKNTWFCYRHMHGGGINSFIAIMENLISCEEWEPDYFSKNEKILDQVLEIKKNKFNVKLKTYKNNDKKEEEEHEEWEDSEINYNNIIKLLHPDTWYTLDTKTQKENLNRENIIKDVLQAFNSHIISTDDDTIYIGAGERWHKNGEKIISKIIQKARNELSSHTVEDVIKILKNYTYEEYEKIKKMELPLEFIPVKNGLVNWKEKKLYLHNLNYFYLTTLNVNFDENARPKHFLEYLKKRFDKNFEEVFKISEEFAYMHFRNNKFQVIPIWMGLSKQGGFVSGEEGKTTTAEMIKAYIGPEYTTKTSLKALLENEFNWHTLKNKFFHPMSLDEAENLYGFEGAIERLRDPEIETPVKNKRDLERFPNMALHILIGNSFPKNRKKTIAFLRSIKHIIYFKNPIGSDWKYLELIDDKEKSGMLNLAIILMQVMNKREKMYGTLNVEDTERQYIAISDMFASLLNNIFERDKDSKIEVNDAKQYIEEKTEESEIIMENMSQAKITRLLKDIFGSTILETSTNETNEKGEKVKKHIYFYSNIRKTKDNDENGQEKLEVQAEKTPIFVEQFDTFEKALEDYLLTVPEEYRIGVSEFFSIPGPTTTTTTIIAGVGSKLRYSDTPLLKFLQHNLQPVSEFFNETPIQQEEKEQLKTDSISEKDGWEIIEELKAENLTIDKDSGISISNDYFKIGIKQDALHNTDKIIQKMKGYKFELFNPNGDLGILWFRRPLKEEKEDSQGEVIT